ELEVNFSFVEIAQGVMPSAARLFESIAYAAEGLQRIAVAPAQIGKECAIVAGLGMEFDQTQRFAQVFGTLVHPVGLVESVEIGQGIAEVQANLGESPLVFEFCEDFRGR